MKATLACAFAVIAATLGVSAYVSAQAPTDRGSPIYNVTLPEGYRDWKLVSVAQCPDAGDWAGGGEHDLHALA